VYRGGLLDVLVTSNTASACSRLGPALAACPRPPLLVVMCTVPGVIAESRSYLRKADPHVTARFDISHQRKWCEMDSPPGRAFPSSIKDVVEALQRFPAALNAMYASPARVSTATQTLQQRVLPGEQATDSAWRGPGAALGSQSMRHRSQ
jgi:hypothetical protein